MSVDHGLDYSRISRLSNLQITAWTDAEEMYEAEREIWITGKCGQLCKKGYMAGKTCRKPAGQGTNHLGYGRCMAHGGARGYGKSYGAVLMAHKFAEELDVSPWEALLMVIRITAGRLRYIESVLGSARDDRELEGRNVGSDGEPIPLGVEVGGPNDGAVNMARNLSWWVEKSESERDRLAKVSKAAIDAGVAQLLIEKELRAGEEKAGEYVKMLNEMEKAGMPDEMLEIARGVMRNELQLALGSGPGS